MKIRPYMEAAEGIEGVISTFGGQADLFFVENNTDKQTQILTEKILSGKYDQCIGVGPEAARYLWALKPDPSPIYSMLLNPEDVVGTGGNECGISLNIPVSDQIDIISRVFPDLKSLGLLYDPANNGNFAKTAVALSAIKNLKITKLAVSHRKMIPEVLFGGWNTIDALWLIPDRTFISESIIQYIIKEAISNNVAVIGFNRFFFQSGAALSFVMDYGAIGRQTGEFALKRLKDGRCVKVVPAFKIMLNDAIIKKVGIAVEGEK
ncbi:ABC transporter substrate-binding protein [Desulforapulum autotrophicum]|nr:ABC transporter substrate binding protein [Desulforapulum autotrophicum]